MSLQAAAPTYRQRWLARTPPLIPMGSPGMPAEVVGHLVTTRKWWRTPWRVRYRQQRGVSSAKRRTDHGPGRGQEPARRQGADDAAILDAAEQLFAERGFTAVTVRDIAAEAGVSHALVHRYLGSKQDVYRAMLARRENAIRDAAPGEDDLLEATSLMLREAVLHQRRYVRLIAHSALHGLSYDRTSAGSRLPSDSSSSPARRRSRSTPATRTGPIPDSPSPRSSPCSWAGRRRGEWIRRATDLQDKSDDDFADELNRRPGSRAAVLSESPRTSDDSRPTG